MSSISIDKNKMIIFSCLDHYTVFKMTNTISKITFEQLGNETILDIFDYLSSNDIVYGFFNLNQRFNSILFYYKYYLSNLHIPTTNIYHWLNIISNIGSDIEHLTISTVDSYFSIDLFPNLKSLIISSPLPIDQNEIYSITEHKQFNNLTTFKIHCEIYYKEYRQSIFEKIFHYESSLKTFESNSTLYFSYFNICHATINVNLTTLSLKLTKFIYVFSCFKYVPNLKHFNLTVNSMNVDDPTNKGYDFSDIKLKKFSFTFEKDEKINTNNGTNIDSLLNLIKQFSLSLKYLSLNLKQANLSVYFDSDFLREYLLNAMIELTSFHFYVKLAKTPILIQNILSTFKNKFWFDHGWSVGTHEQFIYTLPFHYDELDDFIDFDHIESSNLAVLNAPSTWYRVRSINFSEFTTYTYDKIHEFKIKTPNLTSVASTSFSNRLCYGNKMKFNKTNRTSKSVTTIHLKRTFDQNCLQHLLTIFPNVTYLIIPNNISTFPNGHRNIKRLKLCHLSSLHWWITMCSTHFPYLEHLEIVIEVLESNDIIKVMTKSRTLKNLIFYIQPDGYRTQHMNLKPTEFCAKYNNIDLMKILNQYQIKPGPNFLQFIKKT